MKVVNYEPDYYDELLAFSMKTWPDKSEEYLKYRLHQFPEQIEDNRENLLVLNDEGRIIGCTLYFPTRAKIKGEEVKIVWGHDMFVEEEYRGAAGLLLIAEMCNKKTAFGFGTTEINFKIQKELGTRFIGVAHHYLIFNFWSYKLIFQKSLRMRKRIKICEFDFPDKIQAGKYQFEKVKTVEALNIPCNGYWADPNLDIDFVRDEHFLRNRFFDNFIRPAIENGVLVLSVVDFRFNFKKFDQYESIMKAVAMLGRRHRFPLVSIRTSIKYKRFNLYPLLYRTRSEEHIVTNYPIDTPANIFITNADSDSDYLSTGCYQ
jgi:hypothetical protein